MTEPTDRIVAPSNGSNWRWPPRIFTLVVLALLLAIGFLLNLPAVEAPHASLDERGDDYLPLTPQYEHGWPLVYSRREFRPAGIANTRRTSVWRPWEGVIEFRLASLGINLAFWSVLLALTAVVAQYWRSRRQAVWQLDIRDILVLTAAAALLFAWIAGQRIQVRREQALLATYRHRLGNPQIEHEVGVCVPAWWPDSLQGRYRDLFNRTGHFRSYGDSDLACQCRRLVTLQEGDPSPEIRHHLQQMPQLEGLCLAPLPLPYLDATRQATVLSSFPPLPNLRGVRLAGTNVRDGDLAWLATCRRLEMINLAFTHIGDHGVEHLTQLPRLRIVKISSDRLSDAGCRTLAQIATLEDVALASRNISDAGLRELASLPKLRRLSVSAKISEAARAQLHRQLPGCELKLHSY